MKALRGIIMALAAVLTVALPVMAKKEATAASIMAELQKKMGASGAVEAVFTINGGSGPVQGSVLISGARYSMSTPQMKVWYDGKTQWTMLEKSREVSISEPDRDELMATNPFAILNAHSAYYTARRLSDNGGRRRVELTPRDKSSAISRFVLYVDSKTGWPSALVIYFEDDRRIEVTIDRISAAAKPAASAFVFDAKKHPAMEIVDLR